MRTNSKRELIVTAALWTGAPLLGCVDAGPDVGYSPDMTYEEFRAATYREPWEGGSYMVDGDTPVQEEKQLLEVWQLLFEGEGSLAVNTSGGVDTKWTDAQKLNLTYCVSNNFGTNKAAVVEAMRQASDLGWEARGNVNFVHVPAQDATCTPSNTSVVFDVRPVNVNGQYLARAFFPNNARSARSLLVDNTAFDPTLVWPLKNILAHELGHALGFRHEHTRPESGTCFEDNNWRPLTPYDSGSIMHYPQCNGTSSDLSFTARDAQGIVALYGAPGGAPPPPPPVGNEQTRTWSGSVIKDQMIQLSPTLSVLAGTTLTVTMSGSGDPDLYVRWSAAPTTSLFNCRPYTAGATETCALTVPTGVTTAYVAVRGYTAAAYSIRATYTAP